MNLCTYLYHINLQLIKNNANFYFLVKEEHLNLMEKTQDTLNLDHFDVQTPNVDFEVTDSRQKCYL